MFFVLFGGVGGGNLPPNDAHQFSHTDEVDEELVCEGCRVVTTGSQSNYAGRVEGRSGKVKEGAWLTGDKASLTATLKRWDWINIPQRQVGRWKCGHFSILMRKMLA